MAEKECTTCHDMKANEDFWKGHAQCKECMTRDNKRWREANPNRTKIIQHRGTEKYRKKNKDKISARNILYSAIRYGKMERKLCPCGEVKVQGHHEDYSKPLDVDWLCNECHNKLRRSK